MSYTAEDQRFDHPATLTELLDAVGTLSSPNESLGGPEYLEAEKLLRRAGVKLSECIESYAPVFNRGQDEPDGFNEIYEDWKIQPQNNANERGGGWGGLVEATGARFSVVAVYDWQALAAYTASVKPGFADAWHAANVA